MFSSSSTYFHIAHTITSPANNNLVTSVPGVARKRKCSCESAIILELGLLFDSINLPQNKLRQSLASPLFVTFFWIFAFASSIPSLSLKD